MRILVTGAAGFIGFHLCKRLCDQGHFVTGLDNINDYYDVNLKYSRLKELGIEYSGAEIYNQYTRSQSYGENFRFVRLDLEDKKNLAQVFKINNFEVVINLAAQAGVRYSIENPDAYINSNVVGFLNLLECCRHNKIKNLLFASSSSVYGENEKVPFAVTDNVDHPVSLYAATKKSNELMAYTYSHLYNIPVTGLRFFTVYGPWGRPDMAIYLFTKAIMEGRKIDVFNNGEMRRDFTYIDDIVGGIELVLKNPPQADKAKPAHKILNIGNGSPRSLKEFIEAIEHSTGLRANKNFLPMQPGDVPTTWADTEDLKKLGYTCQYEIEEGVEKFVDWYRKYVNETPVLYN